MDLSPTDLKSCHLNELIDKRNESNPSTIEALGLSEHNTASVELVACEGDVTVNDTPDRCNACNGRGVVKPMFYIQECGDCHGTGFDLSDPIKLIKWQSACLKWAKDRILLQGNHLKNLTKSAAELEEESVREFYVDSRLKD